VILTALKAGNFSCGGGDRSGVILTVPLGIGCGVADVGVVDWVEVVDSVETGVVDAGDVSDVPAASDSEEPEQPATRSSVAKVRDRTPLIARRG
jgi:hypothetical protein